MSNTYYFDHEPFAERIAQVITGNLTEDELKADFPEIEYYKVGDTVGKETIIAIDKFMIKDRIVYEVAQTDKTKFSIIKIAQFGDSPTPQEEVDSLTVKRNALVQRMAEYQVPGIVLINPDTFEPFEDETEEGREAKSLFLGNIQAHIRELDTKISAARVLIK